MLDPQQWKEAYFVLQKSNLFICPQNDGAAEDIINLKRLQELSESLRRESAASSAQLTVCFVRRRLGKPEPREERDSSFGGEGEVSGPRLRPLVFPPPPLV